MSSSDAQELTTDHRYFRLHRSISVNHPVHAKVELVSNALDAIRTVTVNEAQVTPAAQSISNSLTEPALGTNTSRTISKNERRRLNRRNRALKKQQKQRAFLTTANAPSDLSQVGRRIEIEEDFVDRKLVVRDFALGMTGDKLESAILVVGSNTADSSFSRGLFSSGAKNVSQLGYVKFETIKNNLYSSCFINVAGMGGMIEKNVPVTDQHFTTLKIPKGGLGVVVTLSYADHVDLQDAVTQMERFRTYFSMRDVLNGEDCVVVARVRDPTQVPLSAAVTQAKNEDDANANADQGTVTVTPVVKDPLGYSSLTVQSDEWSEWFQLLYKYPEGRLEERYAYQVPNYPEAKVYVELYRTFSPLPVPKVYEEDTLEFGYTIYSGRGVHEHSALWPDLRVNEEMRYFFGRIRCDCIDTLMEKFDKEGPTSDNPSAVIDPNRLAGLNRAHPFVMWMLSIVSEKTRLLVKRMREDFDRDTSIAETDILDLAGKLAAVGSQIFNSNAHELDWRQNDQASYLRAVQDAESYIFVRQEDLHQLHPGDNLLEKLATGEANENDEAVGNEAEFLFRDDEVVYEIEQQAQAQAQAQVEKKEQSNERAFEPEEDSTTTVTKDGLKKLRIKDRGELVEIDKDRPRTEKEKEAPRVYMPKVYVDIVYSDDPTMRKRFKYDVQDRVIRITINMRSPCFGGKLTRNPLTKQVCGCDLVSRELIQTFVSALARLYVDRKLLSAETRLVTVPNNQAGTSLLRYAEELDESTILIEREVYRHLGASFGEKEMEAHLSNLGN